MEYQEEKRNANNKVYFLIAIIVALLGTNIYVYLQKNKTEERVVTISDERTALQTELEKLESELDQANSNNSKITDELKDKDEQLKVKIDELRRALSNGTLTKSDLNRARLEIQNLRTLVSNYTQDIDKLKQENTILAGERDSLKTTVSNVNRHVETLSRKNDSLNLRVKEGAILRAVGVSVAPIKIRNNGKLIDVTKASATEKLKISFSVPNNPIADKGLHDVYLRLLDPAGNLMTGENGSFNSDGQNLQYTYKTAIEYGGDSKSYTIDWANKGSFSPGTYTVLLYTSGTQMGKGTFNLR